MPESPVRAPGRFDIIGAGGLSAGLVCLLLGISKSGDWGWGSGTTLGLFAASVVILLAWGAFGLRVPHPLVDLRTTARRQVPLTNLAGIAVGFAMLAQSLVLPRLTQLPAATGYGPEQSMVVAGLAVAPVGVAMWLFGPVAAKISVALGMVHAVWQTAIVSAVIGVGIVLAYAAMPALISGAVPPSETAAANGLNTLMRAIGTSSASAVIGVVLSHMAQPLNGVPLPSMNGLRTSPAIACVTGVLALLISAFLPRRGANSPTPSARIAQSAHGGPNAVPTAAATTAPAA
ncbi:hypothetical protein [Streptomyces sp. DSM 110735]|uniref:hypothetical protein n=1 Tax=Streptomyces sp. DSM 110735 TaxID=2775031 RepID=UPI0027DE90A3|nr:hypothetical protein [Streptomyces sp. DSM 110735]